MKHTTSPPDRIQLAFNVVIILLAVTAIGSLLIYTNSLLNYPYDWEETEGDHLNYARYLSQGSLPYTNNSAFPMVFPLYPPAYHAISAIGMKLFGETLAVTRAVSIIALIITSIMIYVLTKIISKDRWIALWLTTAFLASKLVVSSLVVGRTNTLFIMGTVISLYFIYRDLRKPEKTNLVWIITATLLAGFAKHTAAVVLAPVFIVWLIIQPRRALPASSVIAGITILGVLLLEQFSNGWFIDNIIVIPGAMASYEMLNFVRLTGLYVLMYAPFILFSLAVLVRAVAPWQSLTAKDLVRRIGPVGAYWIGSLALILLFGWNSGASVDYIAPAIIGTVLLTASAFRNVPSNLKAPIGLVASAFLVVIIFVPSNMGLYDAPGPADIQVGDMIVADLKAHEGPVLSDRMVLFTLAAGHEVLIESSLVTSLANSSAWNSSELETYIQQQRFGAVLARDPLFGSAAFEEELIEQYEEKNRYVVRTRGTIETTYRLMVPKNQTSE